VHRSPAVLALAVLALAVLALTACRPIDLTSPSSTPPGPATPPPANAAALLKKLPVAEEDTGAHYVRADWGADWTARGNGCTTRDLVLIRQSGNTAERGADCAPHCPTAQPCWVSPYDGRSTADAGDLQIDHRVPLKEAARSRVLTGGRAGPGAGRVWTAAQRHAYYEDQTNLVAVTSSVNESKSDGDPADWRPANRAAWCDYGTRYIQTKLRYKLTADTAERAALGELLATCPKR
jgi:hypothetical protein